MVVNFARHFRFVGWLRECFLRIIAMSKTPYWTAFPVSFFRHNSYPQACYFNSPQSSSVIKPRHYEPKQVALTARLVNLWNTQQDSCTMTSFCYNNLQNYQLAVFSSTLFFKLQTNWQIKIRKQKRNEFWLLLVKCCHAVLCFCYCFYLYLSPWVSYTTSQK